MKVRTYCLCNLPRWNVRRASAPDGYREGDTTRKVAVEPRPARGVTKARAVMRRKSHVRFLGEGRCYHRLLTRHRGNQTSVRACLQEASHRSSGWPITSHTRSSTSPFADQRGVYSQMHPATSPRRGLDMLTSVPVYDQTPNNVFAWRRMKLLESCPIFMSVSNWKPVNQTGSSYQGKWLVKGQVFRKLSQVSWLSNRRFLG